MLEHTRKHRTDKVLHLKDENNEEQPMSVDDYISECFGNLPQWAVALRGLRNREGLSQAALGDMLGTAQTNISKMEQGQRSIGKNMAKKLAALFHTDYHIFL